MPGPNLVKRAFRPRQSGLQRVCGDAVRPNLLFARTVDRLDDVHVGISLESRKRRNGGDQRERYSVAPLDVSPFGLPAIVTNKPPPYRRFATRLASSIVTASIKALRR